MDAEAVKAELLRRMESDGVLRSVQAKADKGQADFRDSARWSDRAAEILGEVMRKYVPEMPQGTRSALCESVLRRQYTDTMTLCTAVQKALDAKLGLHLAAKIPKFPEERVKQVGNSLEDPTVSDEVIARRSESASANITRSFHDSFVKDNAGFRASAGLRATIVRDSGAKCCDWCANLDGRYEYGSEPKEVFGRHDNCTCTVTYECGRKRQDVWSKRTWEQPEPDAGAGEPVRFSAERAASAGAASPIRRPANSASENGLSYLTGGVRHGILNAEEQKFLERIIADPDMSPKYRQILMDMFSSGSEIAQKA